MYAITELLFCETQSQMENKKLGSALKLVTVKSKKYLELGYLLQLG